VAGGRVLVVSWDGGGNLTPALVLANRLTAAGHELAIMADLAPSTAARVTSTGARLVGYASAEPWPEGVSFEDHPARFAKMRNGVSTARDVVSAAADLRPDVIVVDCMAGAGLVAADVLGLPTAVLVHVLYQPFVCYWADVAVDVSACREAFGPAPPARPAILGQMERADKILVLVPEELDYPGAPRTRGTHYVGAILDPDVPPSPDDPDLEPTDGCLLVLVSLSTTRQRQEALPAILEALGQLLLRGLVTLGGSTSRGASRRWRTSCFVAHVPAPQHPGPGLRHGLLWRDEHRHGLSRSRRPPRVHTPGP
jgi:UDP:flavonoid glycosyltransferase YjiC (YdhE family)